MFEENIETREKIIRLAKKIESDLIAGKFNQIVSEYECDITEADIREMLNKYSKPLFLTPDNEINNVKIIKIKTDEKNTWAVDWDLWTEKGRSDLTLLLDVTKETDGRFVAHILDIHVM